MRKKSKNSLYVSRTTKKMRGEIFSPMERRILWRIEYHGGRGISIERITDSIYRRRTINSQNTVAGAIRKINQKCDENNLNFTIESIGGGRSGKIVWKQMR